MDHARVIVALALPLLCRAFRACALVTLLLMLLSTVARAALIEDNFEVSVTVRTIYNQTHTQKIQVTVWRDDTRDKAPFLVIQHGRPTSASGIATMGRQRYATVSDYFVSRGFVVLIPTRAGYGASGGEDVEYSGPCHGRMYEPVFASAAGQTLAVLEHARALPYVDTSRGIVVGQSFGGATAIAVAALNPPGVLGVVNFAGGSGGDPVERPANPCRSDLLQKAFASYGKTARIPTLWLYSENDRYWGATLPRRWYDAFVDAGGSAVWAPLPSFRQDGHMSFGGNRAAWVPAFEAFLETLGL